MAERSRRHVHVAVPVALDQEFTYSVPDSAPEVVPGMRVLVPFAGRRLTGIVVSLEGDAAMSGLAPDSILDVERVLDTVPVIPASLLELARFIAEYYACPLGEVLRAMHSGAPSGDTIASVTDAGRLAVAGAVRGEKQHALLLALEAGGVSVSKLARRFGDDTPARLREMAERGWVELQTLRAWLGIRLHFGDSIGTRICE